MNLPGGPGPNMNIRSTQDQNMHTVADQAQADAERREQEAREAMVDTDGDGVADSSTSEERLGTTGETMEEVEEELSRARVDNVLGSSNAQRGREPTQGAQAVSQTVKEAIRSIDRLSALLDDEACIDIEEPPERKDEEKDPERVNTPADPGPEVPDDVEPPFLVPKPAIFHQLRGADREITIINRHLFDDDTWTQKPGDTNTSLFAANAQNILKTENNKKIDPFRFVSGKYWYFNKKEEKLAKPSLEAGVVPARAKVEFDTLIGEEQFSLSTRLWYTNWALKFPMTRSEQYVDIYLKGNKSEFFQQVPPNQKGFRGKPAIPVPYSRQDHEWYVDSVFSAEQPFYKKELDRMHVSQFTSADIQPHVSQMDEEIIPEVNRVSLYRAFANKMNQVDDLAQGETLPDRTAVQINCDYDDKIQKFTCESVLRLTEANDAMRGGVGNYVEIEINTQQGSRISSLLHEFRMDKHILEAITGPDVKMTTYAEVTDEQLFGFDYRPPSPPPPPPQPPASQSPMSRLSSGTRISSDEQMQPAGEAQTATATATRTDGPVLSLIEQSNDRFEPSVPERTLNNALRHINEVVQKTITDYERTDELALFDMKQYPIPFENHDNKSLLRFTDVIRSQMFLSKLRNYIEPDKIRSWSDILSGQKAYSEMIGYRIAKHEIIEGVVEKEPLQQFYLMDSDEIRTINFIDTQISTGKRYLYRIHSINFVVGSLYKYEIDSMNSYADKYEDAEFFAPVLVNRTSPFYRIIEAPFFERVVSTEEKPPVFPQVSFLPFQGIADKMQILIQSNFGERFEKPIQILPSDEEQIEKMKEAQPVDPDGKIMFMNDSLPTDFQIFRLSQAPNSYNDFKTSDYIKTIPANGRTLLYTENDFEPNKDYYYMFREIDTRGVSNPTEVYRVKMVSYQNGIYMDMEAYEMQPLEESKISMQFERSLQIMPSTKQRMLSFPEETDIDSREFALSAPEDVNIGTNKENPVWNRNFKLRIKSKTSGRKLDVNFKFVKEVKKRTPDITVEQPEQKNPCED